MPRPLHIFLLLIAVASILLCLYANTFEKNVRNSFHPKFVGWNNRGLHSSQDLGASVMEKSVQPSPSIFNETFEALQNDEVVWIHVAVIYCNADNKPLLKTNFEQMIASLIKYHRTSKYRFHFHVITDGKSHKKSREVIETATAALSFTVQVSDYFIEDFVSQHQAFIEVVQQYFSAKPGSYYSQALFYVSLQFHSLLPSSVSELIFLDVDTRFRDDIVELYNYFNDFNAEQLLALAPELSPVYRHVLYVYRGKHKSTLLGEPKGRGFPGYNSGIVLVNLERIRKSPFYLSLTQNSTLSTLTTKYAFKGHLGDQDFYTLIAMEHPELFYTLPCTWNRQLCQWWRHRGYEDVFDDYFDCKGTVRLYHGNCNTAIPEDAI